MATEAERKAYKEAHAYSDTDSSDGAIHHTLGIGNNKAMPGDIVQGMPLSATPTAGELYDILKKLVG